MIYGLEKDRNVVGIHHFSTIPLKGSDKAITYLQYTGSADDKFMQDNYGKAFGYRGHGIMTLLYAAMAKQAEENAKNTLDRPGGHAGTILESEFIGQASDEDAIRYTKERLVTHGRTGAKTIMLRMKDGKLISPHLQPALSSDAKAIKLLLSYRPAKYDAGKLDQVEQMDFDEGKRVVNAFIDNFDTEGFNKDEVEKARQQVAEWFANTASVELWPPAQLPTVVELAKQDPFLMSQCEDDFGDMDAHAALVSEAFGQKTDAAASVLGS